MTVTRWNRCRPTCGCDGNPSYYADCACRGGCERGSADRLQLLHYALAVTHSLMSGMICPITGQPFTIADSEIDRVDSNLGYVPGNVILVSLRGNSARGILQANGTDLPGIARYRRDVRKASNAVPIMRKRDLTKLPKRNRSSLEGYDGKTLVALIGGGRYATK